MKRLPIYRGLLHIMHLNNLKFYAMKTRNWVLTTLAFIVVTLVNATDATKMNVIPVETQKVLVVFESSTPCPLEISITNRNGDILYYKRIKTRLKEYRKVFDFSELGKGKYNVCLNYGMYSINRNLHVSSKRIEVKQADKLYEPYLCKKDKYINISFFNVAQKNVHLEIYKNGQSIADANLGNDMSIQKRLNLSKLEKGTYELVITDLFKDHRFFVQL
jgi:hypothetical protein